MTAILNMPSTHDYEQPIVHTRAYYNDHIDLANFPKLVLNNSNGYHNLLVSDYFQTSAGYFWVQPIRCELIDSSMELVWNDQDQPSQDFNSETFEKFEKENDREFKNIYSLMHIKNSDYKSLPVSPRLFSSVLTDYMHNLVFTRQLYQDFVDYKNYIKAQKRKKRVNYQQNLKEKIAEGYRFEAEQYQNE